MEAGRARYHDDRPRALTLSLGLSSVRVIVNQIEAECARVVASETFANGHDLVKYDPNIDEGYSDYNDFPLGSPRGRVWKQIAVNLGVALSRCIPSVTFGNFGILAVVIGTLAPRMISYLVVYPFCRLVFGTLYPAYASYKAVRTKNLKEYVKWMMYWIVFALFTCTETFTDVFLSWFPFYYEVKIVLVLWLLSPATKGSSILYRKFVHPALCRREQEIDEYIAKAKDQGYHTVLNLGTKGVNYATTVIMQTAIKGGGGLVQQLRKSYSLSDLSECEPREERAIDEADDVVGEPRLIRRGGKSGFSTRRSASESNSRSPMYFPEVDVDVRSTRSSRSDEPDFSHIKSTEDISSGYSSADNSASLTRTGSVGAAAAGKGRVRATRTNTVTTIKRPQAAEESEVIIEELQDDDYFDYANMPPLVNVPSPIYLSHTNPPFIYKYVGDQVKILQVIGNYQFDPKVNDKMEATLTLDQTNSLRKFSQETVIQDIIKQSENEYVVKENFTHTPEPGEKRESNIKYDNLNEPIECKSEIVEETIESKVEVKEIESNTKTDIIQDIASTNLERSIEFKSSEIDKQNVEPKLEVKQIESNTKTGIQDIDSTSLEISINENLSAESDDEASFGTPEDSPKMKRRSPKGKYGKAKAPPPPKLNLPKQNIDQDSIENEFDAYTTSQESLNDIINQMPKIAENKTKGGGLQVVNPIAEKKRRHKSKSPGRIPKSHSSGLGKLLQLPNKFVFWNKSDDKPKADNYVLDSVSTSGDHSRRSSTIEKQMDDYQSCLDLDAIISSECNPSLVDDMASARSSLKDATDVDNEILSNDIIEKSDALQKIIEAKIESHPEYKYVSLHEEIPTTSKSTDV